MASNHEPVSEEVVQFGDFTADLRTGELRKRGLKLKVEGQPFQVLSILLERPGELVTREELRKRLWEDDTFVDFEHSISAAVRRLRDAMDDSADEPRYIETLPRRGYRFIYPLTAPAVEPSAPPQKRVQTRWVWLASLLVLLVLLAMAALGWRNLWTGPKTTAIRTIAVLPFENLTGDPAQEYIADGFTDALTTELAQVRELSVISLTSTMSYKGKHKRLREIAREMDHPDVFLEGSIRRSGDRVWITVQLVDANDKHLWARLYPERLLSDVPTLQFEVARAILAELRPQLTPGEQQRLARTRQVDPEAYADYVRGREISLRNITEEGHRKSIVYFRSAIGKEPKYAEAYAAMASSYAFLWQIFPTEATMAELRAAAGKAMELDPMLGHAHSLLALLKDHDGDAKGAEGEHRQAIELSPSDALARLRYAVFLGAPPRRRHEEALEQVRRAERLEPASAFFSANVILRLNALNRYEEAVAQAQRAIDLDPNFWLTYQFLGDTYRQMKRIPEAIVAWEKALSLKGAIERWPLSRLAEAYVVTGRMADARRAVSRLEQLNLDHSVEPVRMALAYAAVGRRDDALRMLESGLPQGRPGGQLWDEVGKYLGDDPRFRALRARREAKF